MENGKLNSMGKVMRNKLLILIIFACIILLAQPAIAKAENRFVRLGLEVDNKRVQEKFRLLIYVNNIEVEPLRFENGFVVPDELSKDDKINVRVVFRKYDLFFKGVHPSAFNVDWIVGVDLKPFDPDNVIPAENPPPGKKLTFIYYIHYVARKEGQADTKNIVTVYK